MVISHPGKGYRGVQGNPKVWKQPVKEIIKLFSDQEGFLVD